MEQNNNFKNLKPYNYENYLLKNNLPINNKILENCVENRRKVYNIDNLPFKDFNYEQNLNCNCENIIGYTRIPTGIVGPINILDNSNYVPISTTEGALVSSINRGCKLLNLSKIDIIVEDVGMTRSPIIKCKSLNEVLHLKESINTNYDLIKEKFEENTRFTRLKNITYLQEGRHLHIRFCATCGDAMGMNMVTKSVNNVLGYLKNEFDIEIVTISGNTCTDKKSSAINLINGRGKKVVMEALISKQHLQDILNVSPNQMINLNIQKNLVGSSLVASIGGNNCNAANIIAAIFIATGQDCGQIGTSSYCIINMSDISGDLLVSITMPSLEIATIGGGTNLDDQKNNLKIMGITNDLPVGENVKILAKNIIYCVLGCELSLMSALCNDELLKAHMALNRPKY